MRQKKLSKVEFGFQNVEVGQLPSDIIADLRLDDLKELSHQSLEDGQMIFKDHLLAGSFMIKIDYEAANRHFSNFGEPMGDRLIDHNDLRNLTLCFEDETKEKVELPWSQEGQMENAWQTYDLDVKRPLRKGVLSAISPALVEKMNKIEQQDKFLNRQILTVIVAQA
ncbi:MULTISPECIES: hypothetical protein [Lactobacillus]|uniref:hypothetical protein n=1 Tax=Lactobacillus TaxID=1578 RepID=UPI000CD7E679|nr:MULTISPECIES: hypothetical protein [Lactobacillus]RVU73129.1 hypothetical protein EJK20_09570 [Lactobacillus xujianguonis]